MIMKTAKPTPHIKSTGTTKASGKNSEEIKTDLPLSEKDEVKQGEKNLKESQKKNG